MASDSLQTLSRSSESLHELCSVIVRATLAPNRTTVDTWDHCLKPRGGNKSSERKSSPAIEADCWVEGCVRSRLIRLPPPGTLTLRRPPFIRRARLRYCSESPLAEEGEQDAQSGLSFSQRVRRIAPSITTSHPPAPCRPEPVTLRVEHTRVILISRVL
ncbi:hypothetical protein EYF80_020044 [Liparis tanakae]|uniref:Uncharacterized protein n=1 Tax=Liparis tanakae TaxID=230148 RepID=A0A4Z2HVP2_9TELE|nr:hypothetical protein EYF80_020044 [Liparis tanakae]